jgi:hypothetical protein
VQNCTICIILASFYCKIRHSTIETGTSSLLLLCTVSTEKRTCYCGMAIAYYTTTVLRRVGALALWRVVLRYTYIADYKKSFTWNFFGSTWCLLFLHCTILSAKLACVTLRQKSTVKEIEVKLLLRRLVAAATTAVVVVVVVW